MRTFRLIASDYRKYKRYGGRGFVIVFFTQSFWAIFQYRIAHAVYTKITWQPFRAFFLLWMFCWQKTIEMTTGISIPAAVKIGHSFYIAHFGGVIFNSNAVIGDDCNFSQGVTIGVSGTDQRRGVPIVGDRVYVGANAVLAGKITIGNDVLVGACSLVNTDVKDNCTVVGVPAVVVSEFGSKGYI